MAKSAVRFRDSVAQFERLSADIAARRFAAVLSLCVCITAASLRRVVRIAGAVLRVQIFSGLIGIDHDLSLSVRQLRIAILQLEANRGRDHDNQCQRRQSIFFEPLPAHTGH